MKNACQSLRKWTIAHPYVFTFIGFVFFFLFFAVCKIHANEPTSSELGRDAIVDALGAFAAGVGAFEAAVAGNVSLGIALTALSGLEAEKAWREARQAWNSNSDSYSGSERMGTENDH